MDFVGDGADAMEDMHEWEWPVHCDELREMENLLRCQICGDFFHGPVLLPCSHAFCSECVRKYLQTKGAHNGCCPECKQPCAPRDLIANRAMEKVALLFKQMKPKLLQRLGGEPDGGGNKAGSATRVEDAETTGKKAASGRAMRSQSSVRPMPLVSYNVMKDKEIRKLLDTIGIRLPIKNRDEIIHIHKEYVLLFNAQTDSCNPKSAARLRDEVIKNHRLRQQDKQQAELAKKNTSASPSAHLTSQMKANFERLKQEIAARKANPQPAAAAASTTTTSQTSDDLTAPDESTSPSLGLNSAPVGIWRHVYSLNNKKEFYINSVTKEIRVERPPEFIQQQNPKNRYDDDDDGFLTVDSSEGGLNHSVDLTTEDSFLQPEQPLPPSDEVGVVNPPSNHSSNHSSATKAPHGNRGKGKRPAGFLSPDVSSATQDFSLSNSDDSDGGVFEVAPTSTATANGAAAVAGDGAVSSEDTKWDCPRCTLVNETSSSLCEACGYEGKQQPSQRKRQKKMQFQSKISLG